LRAALIFQASQIWTNLFAGLIALGVALLSNATGSLMPNLRLLLTSPALIWDVLVFSGASALGLIILLNTIASFVSLAIGAFPDHADPRYL
jgi:hypothetical protein